MKKDISIKDILLKIGRDSEKRNSYSDVYKKLAIELDLPLKKNTRAVVYYWTQRGLPAKYIRAVSKLSGVSLAEILKANFNIRQEQKTEEL